MPIERFLREIGYEERKPTFDQPFHVNHAGVDKVVQQLAQGLGLFQPLGVSLTQKPQDLSSRMAHVKSTLAYMRDIFASTTQLSYTPATMVVVAGDDFTLALERAFHDSNSFVGEFRREHEDEIVISYFSYDEDTLQREQASGISHAAQYALDKYTILLPIKHPPLPL